MTVVSVGGVDVAYERAGDGPPLVLAHGAAEDGRAWRPQMDALSDELTVIAWDEPGAGRSSDVPAGFALADYAECLGAVIEDVGLGPAHVGGLSWGGTVVLELYRRRPELCASLILADTYAGWKGSLPAAEVEARLAGVREMLARGHEEFDPTLPGLFAAGPPADHAGLLEAMAADVRPASMSHALGIMAEADLTDVLPRIAVPTLLIWGEQDARSPLEVARKFEQAIAGSELVVIPDCGHVSNLEQPFAFNAMVRDFCRRQGSGTTLGERFARALAAKDRDRLGELLHADVDFRALTPRRAWEAAGPDAVLEILLSNWFEDTDEIRALEQVETGAVADRERVGYRFRVTNPEGEFLVEQQAYIAAADDRISWMRVVCSGFRRAG